MIQTLLETINRFRNNRFRNNNEDKSYLRIIGGKFSDEVVIFPDNRPYVDQTLYFSTLKKNTLTNVKFFNVFFKNSFFDECFFENCVFDNTDFTLARFFNCTLKKCIFINFDLEECHFDKIIFDECEFQGDQKGSFGQAWFTSCHFINTIFNVENIGPALLINSTFSNSTSEKSIFSNYTSEKSIEFKGIFFLMDLLKPENGISQILL